MIQKNTLTIGRDATNDKVFPLGDISGQHARITLLSDGMYKVEDLGSTNGTYVNGYRVKVSIVSEDDQVRLSEKLIIDLPVLFGLKEEEKQEQKKENPKDYTKEFAKLEKVYTNYKSQRKKILIINQRKQVVARIGFMSVPLIIQMITGHYALSGASILLAGAAQLFTGNMKHLDKIEALDNDFKIRYVCPDENCKQFLSHNSWVVWHTTGQCPRCKAIYNKNRL